MHVSVVAIGNSRGIRIPKSILQQLNIEERVELEVHDKELLIRPVRSKPREGWAEEFALMHQNGDDTLLLDEVHEKEEFSWEW